MAFNIFSLKKANEEIARLTGELTKSQADLKTANENAEAIGQGAEQLQGQLATAQADLQKSQGELVTANTKIQTLTGELTTATAKATDLEKTIKDPKGHIETKVAAKTALATAAMGAAPLEAAPKTDLPKEEKATAGLKGFAKVQAAFKQQIENRN